MAYHGVKASISSGPADKERLPVKIEFYCEEKSMALLDVLEYEGGNDILVYRAPQTDFNTHSTLVVRESQEAIFSGWENAGYFRPGPIRSSYRQYSVAE